MGGDKMAIRTVEETGGGRRPKEGVISERFLLQTAQNKDSAERSWEGSGGQGRRQQNGGAMAL